MSLLAKTGLEEYARQCTVQRRRYEDCLQQTQQSDPVGGEHSGAIAQATGAHNAVQNGQFGGCSEQVTQSCMVELLDLPLNPLDWDDKGAGLNETKSAAEAHQWQSDRSQRSYQSMTNPTGKSMNPVSYGAP